MNGMPMNMRKKKKIGRARYFRLESISGVFKKDGRRLRKKRKNGTPTYQK
jgi:hypothetical protein